MLWAFKDVFLFLSARHSEQSLQQPPWEANGLLVPRFYEHDGRLPGEVSWHCTHGEPTRLQLPFGLSLQQSRRLWDQRLQLWFGSSLRRAGKPHHLALCAAFWGFRLLDQYYCSIVTKGKKWTALGYLLFLFYWSLNTCRGLLWSSLNSRSKIVQPSTWKNILVKMVIGHVRKWTIALVSSEPLVFLVNYSPCLDDSLLNIVLFLKSVLQ